tara:strand:+ start:249 stop:788 length:540 start_codon:yes stop_codon:yes gene_type:complete
MPGLNMLGAMNISPVYGFWRVMPFIAGATFGIALVVVLSITSATTIMAKASYIFDMIKYLGAAFLLYIGYIFWRVSTTISNNKNIYFATGDKSKLIAKGFLTATLNPKAWLFFAVFLLVVFMEGVSISLQILSIVFIVIFVESFCMLIYTLGKNQIRQLVKSERNIKILNRINALLMFF